MKNLQAGIAHALHAYYDPRRSAATPAEQVGWKNDAAQHNRFDQLLRVVDLPGGFSINDLGCGLGELSTYLDRKGYADLTYRGFDRLAAMVKAARQRLPETPRRRFRCLRQAAALPLADYTVASGIFNARGAVPEHAWLYHVLDTVTAMVRRSRRGVAFNALTRYADADRMRPELYYADPCFLFDYCKRNFSRDVALLHDYREYDFTLLIRHRP